jgi:hypothetical protein
MKTMDPYYSNLFRARIEEKNWANKEMAPGKLWHIKIKFLDDAYEQIEAFLCESLVTGLETEEFVTAFRCHAQAIGYVHKLTGKVPTSIYTDALSQLSNRLTEYVQELETKHDN